MKNYHRQGANLDNFDQNIEFIFGENNNYQQIGNAYFQYGITVGKDAAKPAHCILIDGDTIRLVKNYSAYCFEEARLATTGQEQEHNKYVGQFSTIMPVLTSKGADLISHLDKIDESEAEINNTSLKHVLINNHDIAANKGKIKRTITTRR